MRAETELMRGAGPVAVLKLLERREMYGYELVEELAKCSEGVLAMGQSTLYPMLYNLESKGLVEGFQRTAPSGRQRRYYRLTRQGHEQLAKQTEGWQAVARALQALQILPRPETGREVPV